MYRDGKEVGEKVVMGKEVGEKLVLKKEGKVVVMEETLAELPPNPGQLQTPQAHQQL